MLHKDQLYLFLRPIIILNLSYRHVRQFSYPCQTFLFVTGNLPLLSFISFQSAVAFNDDTDTTVHAQIDDIYSIQTDGYFREVKVVVIAGGRHKTLERISELNWQ